MKNMAFFLFTSLKNRLESSISYVLKAFRFKRRCQTGSMYRACGQDQQHDALAATGAIGQGHLVVGPRSQQGAETLDMIICILPHII